MTAERRERAPTPELPGRPTREQLREHLVASRIAGDVATSRESNLGNAWRCAAREPRYTFGLSFTGRWSYGDIVALLVDRVGIDPDLTRETGADRIDPARTIDALDRLRDRLAEAATRRERVLLGSGHPAGVAVVVQAIAATLRTAGCRVLLPAAGRTFLAAGSGPRHLRHPGGVAMLSDGGGLVHTHDPEPMLGMLDALADAGEPPPDLVVGDHGFTGAAAQAGIDAVGFADTNDPALFVGEAEGRVRLVVPLDDNVLPHLYGPVTAYLLAALDDAVQTDAVDTDEGRADDGRADDGYGSAGSRVAGTG